MLTLSVATGSPPPTTAGSAVNVWRDERGAVCARAFVADSTCLIEWPDLAMFAFVPGQSDVRVWTRPDARLAEVGEVFERRLLPIILQAGSWQALHASAVCGPAGVVAFCGRSTAGKSTLAFALAQAGWSQLADDALLFRQDGGRTWVRGLPFVPRLRHDARELLGTAAPGADPPAADLPLRMLCLLSRNAALATPLLLQPVPPSQAFSAVLAHAHCFNPLDPVHTARLVTDYMALADAVRVVQLHYRGGLAHLKDVVEAVSAYAANSLGTPVTGGAVSPNQGR